MRVFKIEQYPNKMPDSKPYIISSTTSYCICMVHSESAEGISRIRRSVIMKRKEKIVNENYQLLFSTLMSVYTKPSTEKDL